MGLRKQNSNTGILIIALLMFLTILTPDIRIGSLPAIRMEQVLIIVVVTVVLIKILFHKTVVIRTSRFSNNYLLFPFFMILSSLVGSLKGFTPIVNDFFELYKVFLYASAYLIVSSIVVEDQQKIRVLNMIVIFTSLSGLIAMTQYINLFGLNDIYIPIIAPTQYITLIDGYSSPRVVGMSNNPNVYAIIAGIGFLISFWFLLKMRKSIYLIPMVITSISTLMTLSRSGFIFVVAASVIIIFSKLHIEGLNYKIVTRFYIKKKALVLLLISLLTVTTGIIFINIIPEELTWRLERLMNLSEDTSWQARLIIWKDKAQLFYASPEFGIGPGKQHFNGAADNEWLFLLGRYGVFGTLFLIWTFLSPLTEKMYYKNEYRVLHYGILVGMALYMIPVAIYHSFQLMILIMIIFGCILQGRKLKLSPD